MTVLSFRTVASPIVASIAFVMELTLVPLLLPSIQSNYGLTIGAIAWFFNSYGIAVALGVIIGGWVGDFFGARKIFGVGVLMFALGGIIVFGGEQFEALVFGRVLQGFGGGLFSPVVPVLVAKAMPRQPGKILIIWGSVTGYAAAFAPLAASWLIAIIGWQSVFLFFAVLAGAAFLLFVRSTETQPEPNLRSRPNLRLLLQARSLWLVFGYVFCTYGTITLYLFRLPLRLAENNSGAETIGIVLAAIWFSFSVVSTLLRNLVDGIHLRKIVLAAPLLIATSFLLAYLSSATVLLVLSAISLGAGFACSNAPSTQLVLKFAPKGLSAISTSLDITFARLGGVATVALLAQLGFGQSLVVVLSLSIVASICAYACLGKMR